MRHDVARYRTGTAERGQRGFSLLELILVVLLIALILTLAPRMMGGGVSGAQLKSDVRAVAAAMKLARDVAVNTRKETFVAIHVEQREVAVSFDERVRTLHPKLTLTLYTAAADRIDEQVARFRFFPDGSSNGGRVTIAADERQFFIDVDWLTGRAVVSEAAG